MDTLHNFSLGFGEETELKAGTPDRLLKRQTIEKISTAISLVSLSLGFSIFGMMIIGNRHEADLNGLAGGNSIAMVGGISAVLVGAAFLVAAFFHWRFCAKRTTALPVKRSAGLTFSRSEPTMPIAVLY